MATEIVKNDTPTPTDGEVELDENIEEILFDDDEDDYGKETR
jgi:hypothetical protein